MNFSEFVFWFPGGFFRNRSFGKRSVVLVEATRNNPNQKFPDKDENKIVSAIV